MHSALLRRPLTGAWCFDPGLRALEDWDFWLRLCYRHRYRFAHVATPTVVYHQVPGEASTTGDAACQMAGLAEFGGLVQRIWRRWPPPDGKVTRFRGYVGNMYWLALAEFARGRRPHFGYYLRSIKVLTAAWTGELPAADVVGALAEAVTQEPANASTIG